MSFDPITLLFRAGDVDKLLALSVSDTSQLHRIGVFQFSGHVEAFAGRTIALPNAFDLLAVKLFLVNSQRGMRCCEANNLSDSIVDEFSRIIARDEVAGVMDFVPPNFELFFRNRIRDEFAVDLETAGLMSRTTVQFWSDIRLYVRSQSEIVTSEMDSYIEISDSCALQSA